MALDPNILLQRTTPNLMQALQSGINAGQSLRQAPILEALQKQKLAQAQQQQEQQAALAPLQQQLLQAQIARQQGPGSGGLASAKTEILEDGSVVQALPDGTVQVRDPSGAIVEGAERANVLQNAQKFNLSTQQKEADIAVERLKSELSERNRNAARQSIRLNQALKVASEATQGLAGTTKVQLAKLFPNIDVTNEALLDQSLKQLAVDQLQLFKGPTTDFEFGVVESTTGALGDPKTANVARLKSLQRASWFQRRELDQFSRHTASGGDPDTFAFNFGEPVKTKKGVFTLQDIQDTAVANNLSIDDTLKRLNK
jgi:hypothetical protein